jgi:hypothetical protein
MSLPTDTPLNFSGSYTYIDNSSPAYTTLNYSGTDYPFQHNKEDFGNYILDGYLGSQIKTTNDNIYITCMNNNTYGYGIYTYLIAGPYNNAKKSIICNNITNEEYYLFFAIVGSGDTGSNGTTTAGGVGGKGGGLNYSIDRNNTLKLNNDSFTLNFNENIDTSIYTSIELSNGN